MPERVGLLAGWGRYPVVVAEALRAQGYEICCLGLKDNADPVLKEVCTHFEWLGLAQLGRAIRYYRRQGCERITMAGKIHKVQLFQPWVWLKYLPDWRAVKWHAYRPPLARPCRQRTSRPGPLPLRWQRPTEPAAPSSDPSPM